jgi:phosphoglycerate dehydrogenase-like enzyme
MKAVLHYRATPGFRDQVSKLETDWLRIVVVEETDRPSFAHEMQDADVLLHVLEPVKAAIIDSAPNLKLIQKLAVAASPSATCRAQIHVPWRSLRCC